MEVENNSGQEQTQNAPTEEQTSQNEQGNTETTETPEYHKVFTKDKWKEFSDSYFKNAYNEGKKKAVKDFQNIGIEADSYEDAFETLSNRLKPKQESNEDKGELEQLRERLQAIESEKEEYANRLEQQKLQGTVSQESQKAASELSNEGDLKLDMDKIQRLFEMEHEYGQEDGKYYVSKDGVPVLDDRGNRKTVAQAMKDFIVNEKLITPNKKGVGGGTGSTPSSGNKPKFSEFQDLLKTGRKGDRDRASEMRATAKDIGWSEEDNPKNYRRGRF